MFKGAVTLILAGLITCAILYGRDMDKQKLHIKQIQSSIQEVRANVKILDGRVKGNAVAADYAITSSERCREVLKETEEYAWVEGFFKKRQGRDPFMRLK